MSPPPSSSGVVAAQELSSVLPGARAVHDTLAAYESATGFDADHPHSPNRPALPAASSAGSGDLAEELVAWASASKRLIAPDAVQGPAASSSSRPPDPFDLGDWARTHGLCTPDTPLMSSTPSSDSVELTSDSDHGSTPSSVLSSPAPSSPVAASAKPSGRLPALLPRIRRASAASTSEFPSPAGSPEPAHALGAALAALSLGVDLDAGSVDEQHTPTGASPERRRPRTRELVDQMRRAALVRTASPSPDASLEYSTPPSSGRSASPASASADTDADEPPPFVRPPLGGGLPRCADDLKSGSDEWWVPMEAIPPTPFAWHFAGSPPRATTPSPRRQGGSESPLRAPVPEQKRTGRWHKKAKSSAGSADDALEKARAGGKKPAARGASTPMPPSAPTPALPKTPAPAQAAMMYPGGGFGAGAYGVHGMGVGLLPGGYAAPGMPGPYTFAPVGFGYGGPTQTAFGVARAAAGFPGSYGVPPLVRPFVPPLMQVPYAPAPGMYAQAAGGAFYGR